MSPLRQHQVEGAAWLAARPNGRGYLAHKPGTGKTRTLIQGLTLVGARKPIIVTPAIVRTHWRREVDEMDPLWTLDTMTYSYDEITRGGNQLMVRLLRDNGADALVLDEAHYLKHAGSKRTIQLLGKDGYARRLPHVFLASGTPLPRNPAEIWTVLSSLFPEVALAYGLKTYDQFVKRFCVVRGSMARGVWREKVVGLKPDAEIELRALLGEIMQVKEPGDDVPKIDWQLMRLDAAELRTEYLNVDVLGSGEPWALDLAARVKLGTVLEGIADEPHVARMRRRLGELKAPLVVEMLSSQLDADPTMKVAVFAHHRSVLDALRSGLVDFGPAYVDGDTRHRDDQIEAFVNDPECRVFIGQNIACSTGMDGLQHVTNRAVLVEPDWTPDVNFQLGHRVARMGSEYGHAIVQMVALAGTLDEAIVAQNKRETEMVAAAMPLGV